MSRFKVLASRSSPKGEAFINFDWSQGLIEEVDKNTYEQMINNQMPIANSSGAPKPSSLHSQWDDEDVA
jgi:hypothetical protein